MNLEIYIVTYNRSSFLKTTLESLQKTVLNKYPITILDNCSTDNTQVIVSEFVDKFKSLSIITRKNNIGVCANMANAFEMSTGKYTWILCDDDIINILNFDDVIEEIIKGEVDLIHVGAHNYNHWYTFGGKKTKAQDLYKSKYPYFKFSSFIPCNIFKTSSFQKYFLIEAFNNISNGFPHMPYLLDVYKNNSYVYISKNQLITASETGQSYNYEQFCFWWMRTCILLENKEEVKNAFVDQWSTSLDPNKSAIEFIYNAFNQSISIKKKNELIMFINNYFNIESIILFKKLLLLTKFVYYKNKLKGIVKN